jgi:hypothetical protein
MLVNRKAAIVAIASIFALSSITVAAADVTPSPTPTSTLSPMQQYVQALEQFKVDMKQYQVARALREKQLRVIFSEFNAALKKASEDARVAGKSAATKATLASARAAAAAARDEAVSLLGPEPIAPTPPAKPAKAPRMADQGKKPEKRN